MWILPKQLHTLASVQDTGALISDLQEQSQISAQSLLVRSKPLPVRTWLAKWKRDSWTQHLSGRILKPSLGRSFVTEWISSLEVIPASHSVPQESDLEKKIQDISGLGLQMELLQCDQDLSSLKMLKDISQWGCQTLCKTWEEWVIDRRGEYSRRVKQGHPIRGSESLSWPTANARDWKDGDASCNQRVLDAGHQNTLARAATCWSTPSTMMGEMYPESNAHKRNSPSLATQATWPTPCVAEAEKISNRPNYGQLGLSNHPEVHGYQVSHPKGEKSRSGLADQGNPNTSGSHPESWLTPKSRDYRGVENHILKNGKNIRSTGQVFSVGLPTQAMMGQQNAWDQCKREQMFPTPSASDHTSQPTSKSWREKGATNFKLSNPEIQKTWSTPRTHQGENPAEYQRRSPNVAVMAKMEENINQASKLNPRWVEVLMGLPVGWVMPSCTSPVTIEPTNSDFSETESFQQQQPWPSELF